MRIRSNNSKRSGSRRAHVISNVAPVLLAMALSLCAATAFAQEPLDLGSKADDGEGLAEEKAADSADTLTDTTTDTTSDTTTDTTTDTSIGADGDAAVDPSSGGAAPEVGLDQLLRLPNSLDFKEERRGGGGASDWRRRFRESEESLAEARDTVERAAGAMDEAAVAGSGQWQIAPPGQQANSADNGPLSFKLREDLRRARTALEETERRHRALTVEADLASVPKGWRDPME